MAVYLSFRILYSEAEESTCTPLILIDDHSFVIEDGVVHHSFFFLMIIRNQPIGFY